MKLFELFDMPPVDMGQDIESLLLDILTPFAAQKVPFVTMQQLIDKLREYRTGLAIDPGLIMDVLDPKKVKLIYKIEGDRIYLNIGGAPDRAFDDQAEERQRMRVRQAAQSQAQKGASDQVNAGAQAMAVKNAGGNLQ